MGENKTIKRGDNFMKVFDVAIREESLPEPA
jgi:hypothetical protein